jgi:3-hydroxyacyl-[acyl-carrier-protein] dehydratase
MTTEEVKPIQMDVMKIMELIPHRYPFLLVDRIEECVPGKYVKGYKNVTVNEDFFNGHFPNNPIMPGVLMVEALAQLSSGILMTLPEYKGKLALFAGIDGVRFKRIVRPGDRLDLYSEIVKLKGPVCKAKCRASVNDETVTEAELMFSIR